MGTLVFVYGTLKEGHRNAHINTGRRVAGEFVTVAKYPLFMVGPRQLPWLVDQAGEGEHVVGQLFDVDGPTLERLDALEAVNEPNWYSRGEILIRPRTTPAAAPVAALVYFGAAARLASETVHCGPLEEYTFGHAAMLADSG